MLLLLLISLILIIFSVVYIKWDNIRHQIQLSLRQRFGLVQLDQFRISLNKKTYLTIHITGACIHRNLETNQQRSMVKLILPSSLCKTFPFHIVLVTLAKYITLHIDHLHIKLDDSLCLQIDHVYINSKYNQDIWSLHIQLGPILVLLGAQSLVEMTTACLVTLTACHFKHSALFNLQVQLGKTSINLHHIYLLKKRKTDSQTNNVKRYKDMFSSVRVTIQCLRFIFCTSSQLTFSSDVESIHLDASTSSVRFQTETVRFCLGQQCLFLMSGIEMSMVQQPAIGSPPNVEFLTITWILDTPLLTLPLKNQLLLDAVKGIEGPLKQEARNSTDLPQKIMANVPVCTLAIVLNSPKLELQGIDDQQRSAYVQSKRLIIRLSGEYLVKGRNSCLEDVPSSSSSSASNLDSYFAQEEYKWLSGTNRSSSTSSLNKQMNRHSMHELDETERMTPIINTKTDRWLNLMGRISRNRKNNNDANLTSKTVQQPANLPLRQWTYRVSAKLIVQGVSLGYLHDSIKECIRIKNAVLVLKSRMHVNRHYQDQIYETVFKLGNRIQSEAAIDKPMVTVWEDGVVSASTFWLQTVPLALSSAFPLKKEVDTKKPLPHWIPTLIQNTSFSLDVTQGSLVVWSRDASHATAVSVPEGYIDNTPKHTVYTRMILDTKKFTLVYETDNSINEWRNRCHIEKLYIHQSSSNLKQVLEKDENQHLLLWVSQLNFITKYTPQTHQREGSMTVKMKKYGISYSIRNHYACLLLVRSLVTMKHQLTSSKSSVPSSGNTEEVKLPLYWELLINIARGDVQINLPEDEKLYLRMDGLEIQCKSPDIVNSIIRLRNVMVLGVSPLHTSKWEQLIELDKLHIVLADDQIELKARKVFVSMPYKYVLSGVIDNAIALIKAIKCLHLRLLEKYQDAFTYFGPKLNNDPILIPCIRLRAKVLTVQLDDDPFEVKLRRILRTGLMEQQRRLAYREALDDKIQDMLAAVPSSSSCDVSVTKPSDQQQTDSMTTTSSTIHISPATKDSSSSSSSKSNPSIPIEADVEMQIAEAEKGLLGYYSQFWTKHINESKDKETQFYEELYQRENYRNLMTAQTLDETLDDRDIQSRRLVDASNTFTIDIMPRPLHAPLLNMSVQFVKVNVRPADFNLDETRSFIHTIGGGVPFDSDYSFIIPFHLSVKAGMTWIKVRDYPLPLLYVPPPAQSQDTNASDRVSWRLEGNYALADELGNSGGSRIIPVTVLPASSDGAGYCLDAVRTTSPVKFYSVIDYQILTQGMSMICVSVSYGPAIQDMIHVLETLAPAQEDPSPRLGFWDKVRFVIHTETKLSFLSGGDLAFVVKGSRDPYQLQGRGAGLAKIWSEDVMCLLGYNNLQNEFIQIISQSYKFGVPDLVRGGYVPLLPDALPYKDDKIMASADHKFLKVALKLSDGVRMGIGMSFERLSCDTCQTTDVCLQCAGKPRRHIIHRCRSQEFSPHYQVYFRSAQQVNQNYSEGTYDAFRGFRSDFVHLSFSIVKLEAELDESIPDFSKDDPYFSHTGSISQNAMYLSPCFIEHFVQWWRLFGSPVSIPIRHGKLFPTDAPDSKSLRDHLNTVKYKIVINPLAIGFFCTDQDTYLNVKGGGSAGLKARMNTFTVDLHARKEVVRQHEDEDEAVLKTERNFHEIEISLSDIDLRVIRASNRRHRRRDSTDAKAAATTAEASVYRSTSGSESIPLSEHTDSSSFGNQEKQYSFQWMDPNDYVILDSVPQQQQIPCRSRVKVFPFVFSPLFNFVRQDNKYETERRDYLRQTHDCIFGKAMASHEFQMAHLNRRASELDKVIENHDKQLDIIIQAMNVYKNEKENLTEECNLLCEKIDNLKIKRYMLHTYIGQRILERELDMPNECDSPKTRGRRDELSRWETLMGHFRDRFFIHNPQIIWNNSVRDAIYYWQDIKSNRSVQDYNLSARCLKFLEDLVKTAEKQQQWKPDVPSAPINVEMHSKDQSPMGDSTTTSPVRDKSVTQALIDKLLSERSDNFVAYNEKEEDKTKNNVNSSFNAYSQKNKDSGNTFDTNNVDNVNDPDYQYQNIPENYEMKSKYLIDMINPQVNFQSDKGLNHLILLTNECIHVKAFGIIDHSTSGAADKDVRLVKDRIIVSLDNAQLLVAKKMRDIPSFSALTQNCYGQFQESHWTAWIQPEQLWYYRDLKVFENFQRVAMQLSGTIQLDRYNHLRIKINKYNTSRKSPFEDRTNTMQLHFPQFKLTLNSLQGHILYYTLINLLLGNDGSPRKKERLSRFREVMLAAERSDLAETVKQVRVLQNRSRYLLDMHKRFVTELPYLDALGIREFQKNKKKMHEKLEDLYLVVEAIRSIQTFRRDIHLEETDNAMRFVFTSDEIVWEAVLDEAEQNSLCKWILINTKYVLLGKPNGSTKNTIEVDKMQIINTTTSPVFTNVLDAYIDPANPNQPDYSRNKMFSGVLDSLPPVGGIPIIQHLEINLLPLRLQISTSFGTAMKDYFFPRIERADQDSDEEMTSDAEDEEESSSDIEDEHMEELQIAKSDAKSIDRNSSMSMVKREGSFASFDMLTKKVKETVTGKPKVKADELTIMKKRSSTNRTFIYVRIPAAKHCLSLQGPTQSTFYNLYNFPFKQPKLEYRNKTWSMAEMMEEIQRQFLRAILRHSPALIKRKLLANSKQQLPATLPSTTRTIATNTAESSMITDTAIDTTQLSASSSIDLMDDSIIYNKSDTKLASVSSHTEEGDDEDEDEDVDEEEDGDDEGYIDNDVHSLYSNDPEEEQHRLAELEVNYKRTSYNADKELLQVYMKTYKQEQETDELAEKAKVLFGENYYQGASAL